MALTSMNQYDYERILCGQTAKMQKKETSKPKKQANTFFNTIFSNNQSQMKDTTQMEELQTNGPTSMRTDD